MVKAKTRQRLAQRAEPPPEIVEAQVNLERLKWLAVVVFAGFIGASILAVALVPLAKAIAGTDTNFNLNISIAVNFALAVTTALGGVGVVTLNKARLHHKRRARKLEKRIKELQSKTQK